MNKVNGKKYWFVRKTYGWGWVPGSWQGWAVLGIYTGAILSLALGTDETKLSSDRALTEFFLPLIGLTLLLVAISYFKGESPRWRWGRIDKDERKDD
ncbi:MAG: hypothetical protein WEC83_01460 [Patescibacteria group bacterium]